MKTTIRDFVYVDVERLKSIIAQVEEGVADSTVSSQARTQEASGSIEGGVFGLFKGGSNVAALWQKQVSETRSLHDYIYNKVESTLLKHDLLLSLPEDASDSDSARTSLTDTSFFLANGRVMINDFSQMRLILDNFNAIGKFLARAQAQSEPSEKQKRAARRTAEQNLKLDPEWIKGFSVFFDTFYKDRVVIKLVPYSSDPSFRLVGNLNVDFLRDPIESITYKYGTSPTSSWTMFGQVAAIPPLEGWQPLSLIGGAQIEAAFQNMFDQMRQVEIMAQSVVHPEVAVTPIAVYRESEFR